MSVSDPIADAITKIRNAYLAGHKRVFVNHCNIVASLVSILAQENFINDFEIIPQDIKKKIYRKQIYLSLRYTDNQESVLRGIKRVSKPGRRVYVDAKNIPSIFNNMGCAILSTSRGVIVDRQARKMKIGGEYICNVW